MDAYDIVIVEDESWDLIVVFLAELFRKDL